MRISKTVLYFVMFVLGAFAVSAAQVVFEYCPIVLNGSTEAIMTASVTSNGTCVQINGSNVVLDCNGTTISYGSFSNTVLANGSTGSGNTDRDNLSQSSAINISASNNANITNINVTGCRLNDINASGFDTAINISFANNTIINNTIIRTNGTNDSHGILVYNSTGVWIQNTTFHIQPNNGSGNFGILALLNFSDLWIRNNHIILNSSSGNMSAVVLRGTVRNFTVYNNSFTTNGTLENNRGIVLNSTARCEPGACAGGAVSNGNISNNTVRTMGSGNNSAVLLGLGVMNVTVAHNILFPNGTNGDNHGVELITAQGNNITNNSITPYGFSFNHGVFLRNNSDNNVVGNNTINSRLAVQRNNTGVVLRNVVENNTVVRNYITVEGTLNASGIVLAYLANNNTVINNTIQANGSAGGSVGIFMHNSSGGNILSNTITTNGVANNTGIELSGVRHVVVANNTVRTHANESAAHGIVLNASHQNNITNNTFYANGTNLSHGVVLQALSSNNTFNRNTYVAVNTSSHSIFILSGGDNHFANDTLNNSGQNSFWIFQNPDNMQNFTNVTFATGNGSIRFTGTVALNASRWNITPSNINVSDNRTYVNSSNMSFLNTTAYIILLGLPFGDPKAIRDANDNNGFSNCTARCTDVSYSNGAYAFNVSEFTAYSATESEVITACPVDITQNSTLNNSITAANSCVTFNNSNISLNCNGFAISYGSNGSGRVGGVIAANVVNISITNCTIMDVNASGYLDIGINLTHAHNTTIRNVTIVSNGTNESYGVLVTNSTGATLDNSTINVFGRNGTGNIGVLVRHNLSQTRILGSSITTNGTSSGNNSGVVLQGSGTNLTIVNNTVSANGTLSDNYGIFVNGTSFALALSTISNNNIFTSGTGNNTGILLTLGAANNTINNNTIMANGTLGSNAGIFIFNLASRNNVTGNTVTTRGSSFSVGIRLDTLINTTILANNTVQTHGNESNNHGLYLLTTSINNSIENNTITTNGSNLSDAVRLESSSSNNTFSRNVYKSRGSLGYGVVLSSSGDNQFANDTFNFTAEWLVQNTGVMNNFTNTTFATENGSVRFFLVFTVVNLSNLTRSFMNVSYNLTFVNATNATYLNASARITMNNTNFINPEPYVSGTDNSTFEKCPGVQCTEISFSGGVYVFDVTRFSRYAALEAPVTSGGGSASAPGSSSSSASTASTTSMTAQSMTTAAMMTNQRVSFSVNNVQHSMTVQGVSRNTVTVRVASVPQTLVLKKGDVREISLDNDLVPDFRITVLDIFQSKATFKLDKLEKPKAQTPVVPAAKPAAESVVSEPAAKSLVGDRAPAPLPAPSPAPLPRAPSELPVPEPTESSSIWLPVVLIAVLVVAGVVLLKGRMKKALK